MGNIFKKCFNDTNIYKDINLKEEFKSYTSKGPPVFKDDTFTNDYTYIRCLKKLC